MRRNGRARGSRSRLLLLSVLLAGACGEAEMDRFIDDYMDREHTVRWEDEGRIFILHNGCYGLATAEDYRTNEAYLNCTLPAEGAPVTEDEPRVEVEELPPSQWRRAVPWVERYRWITVNPSFSSTRVAVALASTQLKIMHRQGVVLVYLPQGPDATRVDFSSRRSREHEAERYICGGYRVDHVAFRDTLRSLLDATTTRSSEDTRPPTPVIVTAYSYSGPPTLEVVRDNPNVFFFNVAPNFGWAQWDGSESHEISGIPDCNPLNAGDSYHEMSRANPHVRMYIDNLAFARVPQCLIGSRDDGITIGFRGFFVNMWRRRPAMFNDPVELRPPPEQINYEPSEPGSFLEHEYCVEADPGYPGLKRYVGPDSLAAGGDPLDDSLWEWPVEEGTERTESCSVMAARLVATWHHDLPDGHLLARSVQANRHTVDTLRVFMPRTPEWRDDLSYDRSVTRTFGELAYYGHSGYWLNGTLPPDPGTRLPVSAEYYVANLGFPDDLRRCVDLFDAESCPTCEDAGAWAGGQSPAEIEAEYRWMPPARSERVWPGGPIEPEDVIYLPRTELSEVDLRRTYMVLLRRHGFPGASPDDPGNGDLHVSADPDGVDLQFTVHPRRIGARIQGVLLRSVRPEPKRLQQVHLVFVAGPDGPTEENFFWTTWDGGIANDPYYAGLAGVWMDLYTKAGYVEHGVPYDIASETEDLPIGRVLYMRPGPTSEYVTAASVPDIRNVKIREGLVADPAPERIRWSAYYKKAEQTAGGVPNRVSRVEVREVASGALIPTTTASSGNDACMPRARRGCETMSFDRFESLWDVRKSWCAEYPRDAEVCAIRGRCRNRRDCPRESKFMLRFTAFNAEGNSFFREHTVAVSRPRIR